MYKFSNTYYIVDWFKKVWSVEIFWVTLKSYNMKIISEWRTMLLINNNIAFIWSILSQSGMDEKPETKRSKNIQSLVQEVRMLFDLQ